MRDYLLLLFQEREFVKRKEFAEAVSLPSEVAKEMLESIAINVNAEIGWKLKADPDPEFIVR